MGLPLFVFQCSCYKSMKSKQFTLSDVLAMLAITVIATTPLTAVILFIIAYRVLVG